MLMTRMIFETGRLLGRAMSRREVTEQDIDAAFDRAAAADARWEADSMAGDGQSGSDT
jgi:hypothetical protein